MTKVPAYIITIRYILVAVLLYFIWIGNLTAIKILCTLVIFHSEFLYIANRIKEVQVEQQVKALKEGLFKGKEINNVKK